MVKDEADAIGGVIRHLAAQGARGIAVLNNGSTDGTGDTIDDAFDEVRGWCPGIGLIVVDDPEVGYYQSRKITALINRVAQTENVGWVIPFDADEIWHAGPGETLAEFFDGLDRRERPPSLVAGALLSHFCTGEDERAIGDPFIRLGWRTVSVAPLPKVAFRWRDGAVVRQGNHSVELLAARDAGPTALTVRHFPYRSEAQFVRKVRNGAAAYAAAPDLPEGMGDHWKRYGELLASGGEAALLEVYREHFWYRDPAESGLVFDPAPYAW
jgi:hypothetical protein